MTGFISYFRAHLRSGVKTLIYLIAITLILTVIIGMNAQVEEPFQADDPPTYRSTLYIPVIVLVILIYLVPLLEFSFFKKRINLNCAYSMPISRRAMGTVHYLTGAITITTVYTLSYLANFILLLTREAGHYVFQPMIEHYFLTLLFGLAFYSLMCFVFNEANTTGDGVCFMLLWSFAMFFVSYFLFRILGIETFPNHINQLQGSNPFDFISQLTNRYQILCELDTTIVHSYYRDSWWSLSAIPRWQIVWIFIGIASALGLIFTFGKRRMEKTEEISDSFFGYRVLIPFYAVTSMFMLKSFFFWVIFEILALIGYTIYRRGFRYKLSDIIILLSMLIFLFFI